VTLPFPFQLFSKEKREKKKAFPTAADIVAKMHAE